MNGLHPILFYATFMVLVFIAIQLVRIERSVRPTPPPLYDYYYNIGGDPSEVASIIRHEATKNRSEVVAIYPLGIERRTVIIFKSPSTGDSDRG